MQGVEVVGTDQVIEPFSGLLCERDDFDVSVKYDFGDRGSWEGMAGQR